MQFVIQFEVPTDKLINIIDNPVGRGLVLMLSKDKFDVQPVKCKGCLKHFVAISRWDVSQVKKMWQVESRLKRANIAFNVKTVR